jgi:redox-sensitive bicupin YhaK (pirin superfamily)
MINARKATERGQVDFGWLKSAHTFSFGSYHNPQFMGFSVLRVINEDRVVAAAGFPSHSHQNMEILTYVVEGALEHKDSLGNVATIKPGDLQRMSAGTGVTHSEYNPLKNQNSHFLQIWIFPEQENIPPSYQQKNFESKLQKEEFVLIASQTGRDASVSLNQDVDLYALKSSQAGERILNTDPARSYWLQVIKGVVKMNDRNASAGDALQARGESRLHFKWSPLSEFLIFDLP